MNNPIPWFQHSVRESLEAQKTSIAHGLDVLEAERRATEFGLNELEAVQRKSALRMLLAQFKDLLVMILIGAAIIAQILGEAQDTIAIVAIIILNAILGFTQEFRAERAMEALQALSTPLAKVRRAGQIQTLPAYQLVPGDIVLLEAGNFVPADLRILESFQLSIDESTLTGESLPVDKQTHSLSAESLPIADQKNMAFKGTMVTAGRAVGLIVRIGMNTELGRIAKLLKEEVEVRTPLQNRIAQFAKKLSLAVLGLCLLIFLSGLWRGVEPVLMFMTALSLAVAAIPEALPAVVTMSLALGARAMIRRNALIRKLPAVESLGSVTYICTDKTGTLTENRMSAQAFYLHHKSFASIPDAATQNPLWNSLLRAMTLNTDVSLNPDGSWQGDPTEIALVQAAHDQGLVKEDLEKASPRVAELPFSSERGMMSTVHQSQDRGFVITKGAPERVLPLCQDIMGPNGLEAIDQDVLLKAIDSMALEGFRVLAFAKRDLGLHPNHLELSEYEQNLTLIGLVGLIDPPRSEAKEAVRLCQSSGIKVVMITGDHPKTAQAIALKLGIAHSVSDEVMTGQQLLETTDEQLLAKVLDIRVYARAAPDQKIRIVKALQTKGEIVAMTGDGVNDAPALRRANVGVSMGKGGTDVAREASHVILLDDNFASIIEAVREGRKIYSNIRKFVRFALSGNSGEIWTLFLAPFLGLPIPLLPIHILWVNLVTDGLPGLALAMEPEEKNIMHEPPRHPEESVFALGLWQHSVWVGILTAALTLGVLAWAYHTGHAHWQSMAFTVLTLVQMAHVMAIRSETESTFSLGFTSNKYLLGAVLCTLALQMATLYIPSFNSIFKTAPLSLAELGLCLGVSSLVFFAVEIEKWFKRRRRVG